MQLASKIANNSRNIETARSIIPFSPKEESKREISERTLVEKYYDKLSKFEKEELKNHKDVFFLGRMVENEFSCKFILIKQFILMRMWEWAMEEPQPHLIMIIK